MKDEKEAQITCSAADREAMEHFKQAIASGEHWYLALLEAIGLWSSPEEIYMGRHYRYLIAGEAFDWLLLAERLCQEVNGFLPQQEMIGLLFHGKPPLKLSTEEFKSLIGSAKYHTYLNYFYGVVVERALVLAVDEEIEKERRTQIWPDRSDDSYLRIYGANQKTLLHQFRGEKGYPQINSITISELQEFTYWLFKYRLQKSDKARVASDTKKALTYLERLWGDKEPLMISLRETL
jgi:hypothetical protein